MAPRILKRPLNAVQCSSCKQRYDTIEALHLHLQTSITGRRICPKTTAPALIVCIDCERDFSSVDQHTQHIKDSYLHNPELSQPTGRTVYVGRLPDNIKEHDIIKVLFKDFVVETTSVRTHCPHIDNFAFVNLTTVAEANRAVVELHNKRLFNMKVVVSLQRAKEDSVPQTIGREARSQILGMGPSKGNPVPQPPAIMQRPLGDYASMQPHASSFSPYRAPFPFNAIPPITHNQLYPTLPFSPPLPVNHAYSQPMRNPNPPMFNHNFISPIMPGYVHGGFLASVHQPSASPNSRRSRRPQKQPPHSFDGTSDTPLTSNQSSFMMNTSITSDEASTSESHAQQSLSPISEPSGFRYSDDHNLPAVVSSGPDAEAEEWTFFREDELEDAYRLLQKHCHSTNVLTSAGLNVTKPTAPPAAVLKAKVKCRACRISRAQLERRVADESGPAGCTVSRNGKHAFPGISHLTARYEGFKRSPSHSRAVTKRRAIALDCEMAGGWNGDGLVDQLIQLTAIDYLTGEVLISTLVEPTLDIQQWRSSIHGVNRAVMAQAVQNDTALKSAFHARDVLFSLMDANTILVGHALKNDLNVLKIAHSRCVDSEVLAISAINRSGHNGTSLKKLCDTLMGLAVQMDKTHSCLEDSFAAREAVIFMTSHPEALKKWAKAKQKVLDEEEAKRLAAKQAKEREAKRVAAKKAKEEAKGRDALAKANKNKEQQKNILAAAAPEVDATAAPAVLPMTMPALIPTPANEIPDELQLRRGPAAGKKRKGGKWKVINPEEE